MGPSMAPGEAAHHVRLAPYALHSPDDGGARLMTAFGPETEQPYYFYEGDTAREIARRHGELDTTVSNPEWVREPQLECSDPLDPQEPPPRRSDYPLTQAGMNLFRSDRAAWYFSHTGRLLLGSLELVNILFDLVARNFRMRSDR